MIDPKTAWLLAKTIFNLLALLLKSAALISMIYFAVFTTSFFLPFFTATNNPTLVHEAKLVYICCFIVSAFLALLIAEQLINIVLSLFPGRRVCCWKLEETLWYRVSYIIVVGLLLSAVLFGTLYPLFKALAWRDVFVGAGRADLEEQAMALVVFMGIALGVGIVSLLRLSWVWSYIAAGVFVGTVVERG
ncbi:hypothetical protein N0V82_008353 [Gnomoniopsis sp. IMI 355080]|nr:hypothetical protein N0V82_008353 [Gnomoniopsis sp. IMI 355080]